MTTKQMIDIFYNTPETLNLFSLEKYMLTHTFFETYKQTIPVKIQEPDIKKEIIVPAILVKQDIKQDIKHDKTTPTIPNTILVKPLIRTRFRAFLKDSLFWCMYVHSHGQTAFETTKTIGTNMLNLMMNEKRLLSDFFNKDDNKTALKNTNHKITNIKINEIKCDLMTKPMLTSIESLIVCCVYWKCPIYVDLGNKTFLHFVPNTYVSDDDDASDGPNAVLLYAVEGRFEMEMDAEKKSHHIQEMRQSYYKIPHYEKPLLSIATYKTEELQEIYGKIFGTGTAEKMKKQEYYNAIAQKCVLPTTMF